MIVMYQYITKLPYTIHQRLPFVINGYKTGILCSDPYECQDHRIELLLDDVSYHRMFYSGLMQYNVLFIPNYINDQHIHVTINAWECNYILYNGPGIHSPLQASSSTHGPVYITEFNHHFYLDFWGTLEKCQNVSIQYLQDEGSHFKVTHTTDIYQATSEPIICSNISYSISDRDYEIHVYSSNKYNA